MAAQKPRRGPKIYICGGDYQHLDDRDDCPNTLHDWPLPQGYCDAAAVADARLAARWSNNRCPDCGIYGWAPTGTSPYKDNVNAVHVPYSPDAVKKPKPRPVKTITLPMEDQ